MNRQTILILIFVVVLGSISYVWYQYVQNRPRAEAPGREGSFGARLSELKRLKDLQLDISIFQDPFFKSLRAPEGIAGKGKGPANLGRNNPFLPF